MNCIYRSIWNQRTGTCVAVCEHTRGAGKKAGLRTGATGKSFRLTLTVLAASVLLAAGADVYAVPVGGVVSSGAANIVSAPGAMTINQSSANVAINWQSFGIARGEAVRFVQPSASSVALNRVLGTNPSTIFGSLNANGKVFLVNPNGILFGSGASVNVGGLVASTLNITDGDFASGKYKFTGSGSGAVSNQGSINASSGYVALLGNHVDNGGVITARLGTVALASGSAMTLDLAGDSLLNVRVDQGAVNALVQNGGLIQADGGQVLMTTQAAGNLLSTAVNNSGVIQAQTVQNKGGVIKLLGDMSGGIVNVTGTLDASAPNGGNGGFIETSAAHVNVRDSARITTASARGTTGSWLIDPQDFTIGSGATDKISGPTLSGVLVTNSVTINTDTGSGATVAGTPPVTSFFANPTPPGNGDINVNAAVTWTAVTSPTTLTLLASRDVNVSQAVSATNGNFVVCCGRDVNVNAAVTTVNGSVLLAAGRNVNLKAALTTTDGNISICAANDINVASKITLTRGSSIPAQSLSLPIGLVFNAGYGGTGPGVAGGTVTFDPLTPATVNGPNAPVTINYNPVFYTAPTDYSPNFILTLGATLTQHMLVFPAGGDKTFDGTTTASLAGLKGAPAGVTLIPGSGSTASFTTPDVGLNKTISFTGYSLGGPNAANFALPISCCAPIVGRTSATIAAATVAPAPVVTPAPVAPAPVVTPAATAPAAIVVPQLITPPGLFVPPPAGPPLAVVPPPAFGPPVAFMPAPVEVPPPVIVPPPTIVVPESPPETYIPPRHRRKQDRN